MPADGFYEWHRLGEGRRQENRPYLFRRPDRGFFAFAALWETWHSPDGSEIDTVAIVTGPANGQMAAIHHRSPSSCRPRGSMPGSIPRPSLRRCRRCCGRRRTSCWRWSGSGRR